MKLRKCLPSAASALLLAFTLATFPLSATPVPIMFTGSYSQDFNTLANTGTSSSMPTGWYFDETGTSRNLTYGTGAGTATTGNTYSFGSSGSSDRALGGLRSGTLVPILGAAFQNATPGSIRQLEVTYIGEQWRRGSSSGDHLDFQYSIDATSLADGTWTDVDPLDFLAPITIGTGLSLDGNAPANRAVVANVISGLSWSSGATLWVRWNDFPVLSGSNDGLAVDDFIVKAISAPAARNSVPETLPIWWPTVALGSVLFLARRSSQRSTC